MSRNTSTNGVIAGIILIGLGGLFLVAQVFGGSILTNLWPFLVIGAGLLFFAGMVARGRGAGGLAIPGSIVTTVGLILLVQNTFGLWDTWSFVWGLIIVAVGVGIFIRGLWDDDADSRRSGPIVALIGFVLFVIFGAFFGLNLSRYQGLIRQLWPLLLIGLGVLLILRWFARSDNRGSGSSEPEAGSAIEASSKLDTTDPDK